MNITILGAGNMGTALAVVLGEKKENLVKLWSIEESVVENINENCENEKYLPGIKLRKDYEAFSNARKALKNTEIVVFSVPSNVLRNVCRKVKDFLPERAVIIDVAKGLEKKSNKRMSEVLREYFNNPIVSVGGPSIANELAQKIPTFVVYASENNEALKEVKTVFQTNYYNISTTNDVIGVEIGGFLKNVIAILAGIIDGKNYGMNTKSGVITKGVKEMEQVFEAMGAERSTVYSLAGIGDLIVTCTSEHSRNRSFGELLGKGMSVKKAKKRVGQVVEGVNAARLVMKIIKNEDLDCPLMKNTHDILFNNKELSLSVE